MKLVRHVVELFLRPRRSFMTMMKMMLTKMMIMMMMMLTCYGVVFEGEKIIHLSSFFMKSTFERFRIVRCYKDLNEVMLLSIGNATQHFTQFL